MHKQFIKPAVILSLIFICIYCSSSNKILFQKVSNIPDGKIVIYLYRAEENFSTEFEISCNGSKIGTLERRSYFPIITEPGKTVINSLVVFKLFATGILDAAVADPTEFVMETKPGMVYYVKCSASEYNGQVLKIDKVPEDFGEIEIKNCRLLEKEKTD